MVCLIKELVIDTPPRENVKNQENRETQYLYGFLGLSGFLCFQGGVVKSAIN